MDLRHADYHIGPLRHTLQALDAALIPLHAKICATRDAQCESLLDRGEFLIGTGFTACQRYMRSRWTECGVAQETALDLPPIHRADLSVARHIHIVANLWKHESEWEGPFTLPRSEPLPANPNPTLQRIESIIPWGDYTCAGHLSLLSKGDCFALTPLAELLVVWHEALCALTTGD